MKSTLKRVFIAVIAGYLLGVVAGAIWIGGESAIPQALIIAPMGFFMAFDEFIWGSKAVIVLLVAFGQLLALAVASRLSDKPILAVTGSFLAAIMLSFLGGSTAAAIASV